MTCFPGREIHRRDPQRIEKRLCVKAIDVKDRIDAGVVSYYRHDASAEGRQRSTYWLLSAVSFSFSVWQNHPDTAHSKKEIRRFAIHKVMTSLIFSQ